MRSAEIGLALCGAAFWLLFLACDWRELLTRSATSSPGFVGLALVAAFLAALWLALQHDRADAARSWPVAVAALAAGSGLVVEDLVPVFAMALVVTGISAGLAVTAAHMRRSFPAGGAAPAGPLIAALPLAVGAAVALLDHEVPVAAFVVIAVIAASIGGGMRTSSLGSAAHLAPPVAGVVGRETVWEGADRWTAHKHGARVFGDARLWGGSIVAAVHFAALWWLVSDREDAVGPGGRFVVVVELGASLLLGSLLARWAWLAARREGRIGRPVKPGSAAGLAVGAVAAQGILLAAAPSLLHLPLLGAWLIGCTWNLWVALTLRRALRVSAFGGARGLAVAIGLGQVLAVSLAAWLLARTDTH